MHFVLISIICSVSVAVLLKYARRAGLDTWQMIVWNYPAAVCLTYFIFQPDFSEIVVWSLPWHLYIPVAILLPTLFMILSQSLRYAGLVQTEVAQRISLVLSLLAAVWLFDEVFSGIRIAGIIVGFAAITCLIGWRKRHEQASYARHIFFPVLVFAGYGAIDILFKLVALERIIPYTTAMFFMFLGAMLLAFVYLIYQHATNTVVLSGKAAGLGIGLGLLNFCNILFYMKAHQVLADNPSVVFTGMNIGVIGLGSVLGIWLFKEKLSMVNVLGIVLAIVSVFLIAYS